MPLRGGWIAFLLALLSVVAGLLIGCSGDEQQVRSAEERLAPGTYVPVVGAHSLLTDPVAYYSGWSRDGIYSWVSMSVPDASAKYGALNIAVACQTDSLEVYVSGLQEPAPPGIVLGTLVIDNGVGLTLRFQSAGVQGLELTGAAAEDFYNGIRFAKRVEFRARSVQLGPSIFGVSPLFETPVQDNLDYCGDYHPTERRYLTPSYEPVVGVSGSTGSRISYEASERVFGSRSVLTTFVEVAPDKDDAPLQSVRLRISCIPDGTIRVSLVGLPNRENIQALHPVTIEMRHAERATEYWWFTSDGGAMTAQPADGAILSGLLLTDGLALHAPSLDIGPLRFDVNGLFFTPVQGNLDHCGNYAER